MVQTAAGAGLAVTALAVLAIILMVVAVRAEAHGLPAARLIRGFAAICAVLAAAVALVPER